MRRKLTSVLARAMMKMASAFPEERVSTGCSIVQARFQKTRKNRLFLRATARRTGLVGVLPQNGLR